MSIEKPSSPERKESFRTGELAVFRREELTIQQRTFLITQDFDLDAAYLVQKVSHNEDEGGDSLRVTPIGASEEIANLSPEELAERVKEAESHGPLFILAASYMRPFGN